MIGKSTLKKKSLLYLLIFSESVPIVPTDTKSGGNSYTKWIKHSAMKVRPWQWTPFTNSARGSNDTFILYHWQHKLNPDEPQQEYPFAKFNKVQQNSERERKKTRRYFVKHELKGVLKCIGVEIWTPPPPQTVTDTLRTHDRQRRNPP
jgi:hypothetical protein